MVAGLQRLESGAHRLEGGLGELEGGAGALQHGLARRLSAFPPAAIGPAPGRGASLSDSLTIGQRGAIRFAASPRTSFESGYFVLSALDGAPPRSRAFAGESVDLGGGGQAARMLVVSTQALNTAGSRAFGSRLNADAARIGARGGDAHRRQRRAPRFSTTTDPRRSRGSRLVIAAVILITFLILVVVLRALPLAALAVVLNLGSVGAALGVMTLVSKIPAGYPLGGHPYIDTVGAAGIFAVTFGLSIDYAVFLIARMRERYERRR